MVKAINTNISEAFPISNMLEHRGFPGPPCSTQNCHLRRQSDILASERRKRRALERLNAARDAQRSRVRDKGDRSQKLYMDQV